MSDQQPGGAARPAGEVTVEHQPAEAAQPAQPAQAEFGRSLPGQPPAGYPTGPGVDMYGNKVTYADPDPAKRTGDPQEIPPIEPAPPEVGGGSGAYAE